MAAIHAGSGYLSIQLVQRTRLPTGAPSGLCLGIESFENGDSLSKTHRADEALLQAEMRP